MKNVLCFFLALVLLPFLLPYSFPRYIYYNRQAFWRLVEMRRHQRADEVYMNNYNFFHKELIKDEN